MALRVSAFRGVLFDPRQAPLERALCPPYDVIPPRLADRLRRDRVNAIHVELPAGDAARYLRAKSTWRGWLREGVLRRDEAPGLYVVEQAFREGGRGRSRVGLLAELGLDRASAARVLPHERTLSKPKKDRTRLLKTLGVNTSPIFAVYHDPGRRLRRLLAAARRRRPDLAGEDPQGVRCRLWRVDSPAATGAFERAFSGKRLLIADGHHRFAVARRRARGKGGILAYLCAEEDPGLVVYPTHRVVRPSPAVHSALERHCRRRPAASLRALGSALARAPSPYALGLYDGRYWLLEPAPGDSGVPTGFGTEWVARRLLASVDPHDLRYVHDAPGAVRAAREVRGWALLLKPFTVKDIRRAVERAGLLPQKSTYFIPKVATGLVFREVRP